MSTNAKKIPELTSIGTANTSIASGDLFVIEDVSANTTKSGTLTALRKAVVQGPYDNDVIANNAGVQLGQMYYTSTGSVKVRLT
jgi:outer membrane lipoprotein SlyB